MPCTALQPWRASFVQQCFRPLVHGNRLHPQQVAFYAVSLELHPTPYRSALPSAALRPPGSICAAMLSLSNATLRIARRQSTRSSPHSRPAGPLAVACIRIQPRPLLPPTDPYQAHGFCCSLYLRGEKSESPQQSLTCPRPSASLQASLPACCANRRAQQSAAAG